jgi:pimeloyl-ACP methyl ester carboxylesterase
MFSRSPNSGIPRFKLPVVVLRHSWWKNSNSPMLHLSGGPGGPAYLDRKSINFHIRNFIAQNWGVDFVLYDQRGTGLSTPKLRCERYNNSRLRSLASARSTREEYMDVVAGMQECLDDLTNRFRYVDHLRYISTDYSVSDISDLHDLLNVDQWVLMGASYGTRLALESARKIPQKVKSMVLDSVYPPEVDGFEALAEIDVNALENILALCQRDVACSDDFPELESAITTALIKLEKAPWQLEVMHRRTEAESLGRRVILTAGRFMRLLSYASYDSLLLKDIPAAIMAVANDDKGSRSLERLAENLLEIELFENFSDPVYMVTECLENGDFDRQKLSQKLQHSQVKYPMLDFSLDSIYDSSMCNGWSQLSLSKKRDFRLPVNSDIPSLVLAGGLDSVTPARWARDVVKGLTSSLYLEYPHVGHGVLHSSLCANDEVQRFLNPEQQATSFCSAKNRLIDRVGSPLDWAL